MTEPILAEILELHEFFESWLSGTVEKSKAQYARFESAMAEGFIMVPPGSNVLMRDTVMEVFWQQHASVPSPFKIEIRNPVIRKVGESLYLVHYEEWQIGAEQTGRISTALLRDSQPGIQWLSVHESWLPEG